MNTNIQMLEVAVGNLTPLLEEVVFVGGVTVELWISDPLAPPVRATADVDVVVEISTQRDYYRFEKTSKELGIQQRGRQQGHLPLPPWRNGSPPRCDADQASILGFENRWQAEAYVHAVQVELPAGKSIRAIPPHFLLATKLEAFRGRGMSDFYESRDFEDIVRLIDGRSELLEEVASAPQSLRGYISEQLEAASRQDQFDNGLEGALPAGPDVRERVDEVIWPRVRALIG